MQKNTEADLIFDNFDSFFKVTLPTINTGHGSRGYNSSAATSHSADPRN
jgi:hypothetical protein